MVRHRGLTVPLARSRRCRSDVVLERPNGEVVGVEVKVSFDVHGDDAMGLRGCAVDSDRRPTRATAHSTPYAPNSHAVAGRSAALGHSWSPGRSRSDWGSKKRALRAITLRVGCASQPPVRFARGSQTFRAKTRRKTHSCYVRRHVHGPRNRFAVRRRGRRSYR